MHLFTLRWAKGWPVFISAGYNAGVDWLTALVVSVVAVGGVAAAALAMSSFMDDTFVD